MTRNINKVIVSGNLGADPEIVRVSAKVSCAKFSVAVNEVWTDTEGHKQDRVNWVPVVAWNGIGEKATKYLKKGSAVLIEGNLRQNSWEDKDTKKNRSKLEVVARDIIFLDRKPQDQAELPITEDSEEHPF